MSSVGVSARLARREVRRRPGRTVLVGLLIAMPVGVMFAAMVLIRTVEPSAAERFRQESGTADVKLFLTEELDQGAVRRAAPVGTRFAEHEELQTRLRTTSGRRSTVRIDVLSLANPVTRPMIGEIVGRAPRRAGEILLSPDAARSLGVGVGDTLHLKRPRGVSLRVVGLGTASDCYACSTAVMSSAAELESSGFAERWLLVDLPPNTSTEQFGVFTQNAGGYAAADIGGDDGASDALNYVTVAGGLVLAVTCIVIAAAFAVGARRQLVTLGQLSANGASPGVLRSSLALQGSITGLLGSVTGVAVASMVLVATHDQVERWVHRRYAVFAVSPRDLVVVVGLGTMAATLGALFPAWSVHRIPVLSALAGRRPSPRHARRVPLLGMLAFGAGLALIAEAVVGLGQVRNHDYRPTFGILGGMCVLFGFCAMTPAIVGRLEPLAARLRGTNRLAARSLARQPLRTGAVIAAVAAAGALAVGAASAIRSAEQKGAESRPTLRDDLVVASMMSYRSIEPPTPELLAELRTILPSARETQLSSVTGTTTWKILLHQSKDGGASYSELPGALVLTPRAQHVLDLDSKVTDELEESGVVVIGLQEELGSKATVVFPDGTRHRVATFASSANELGPFAGLIATPELADRIGEVAPAAVAFETDDPIDADTAADLHDLSNSMVVGEKRALSGPETKGVVRVDPGAAEPPFLSLVFRHPDEFEVTPFGAELILSGVALLLSLLVVAISLSLSAAEGRDERDLLSVIGLAPRRLARVAATRALVLAGIGGICAIPLGLIPLAVALRADDNNTQFRFPIATAVILVVVVPLAIAAASYVSSSLAQRLRPIHVSTALFE